MDDSQSLCLYACSYTLLIAGYEAPKVNDNELAQEYNRAVAFK